MKRLQKFVLTVGMYVNHTCLGGHVVCLHGTRAVPDDPRGGRVVVELCLGEFSSQWASVGGCGGWETGVEASRRAPRSSRAQEGEKKGVLFSSRTK